MPIKHADFIIKGMHRDLSESAFSSEYSYENQNIRITTDKNDSSKHTGDLMALTNERGNKYTPIIGLEGQDMQGVPIGQCMINNQWVVFYTSKSENVEFSEDTIKNIVNSGNVNLVAETGEIDNLTKKSKDKIYRLWMNEDNLYGELLYEGNLGFDWKYPIETLGYYENESIQKVYWTDGLNQPRFINIVEKPEKKALWNDNSFNFVQEINLLDHNITITEKQTGGKFPAGMIQWHFTYSKQFGQETAIFESTKLYEIKFANRGAAPDEQTSQSFEIVLTGLDTNFDFVNIYSLIRTSLDNVPIVKCIATLPIVDGTARFVDTNLYGAAVDPQELLYKGGELLTAYTMENKDNTLFLGNYSLKRSVIPQHIKDELKNFVTGADYFKGQADYHKRIWEETGSTIEKDMYESYQRQYENLIGRTLVQSNPYSALQFDKVEVTSEDYPDELNTKLINETHYFKYGNVYRLGIQFQHLTGKWSEVIWLGDYECDKKAAYYDSLYPLLQAVFAKVTTNINLKSVIDSLVDLGYVKARPVAVYPNQKERKFIAQGLLSNTVYFSTDDQKLYPDYLFRFANLTDDRSATQQLTHTKTKSFSDRKWVSKVCDYNLNYDSYDSTDYQHIYLNNNDEYSVKLYLTKSNNLMGYCSSVFSFYSPDIQFNDSLLADFPKNCLLKEQRRISRFFCAKFENEVLTSTISNTELITAGWRESGYSTEFNRLIDESLVNISWGQSSSNSYYIRYGEHAPWDTHWFNLTLPDEDSGIDNTNVYTEPYIYKLYCRMAGETDKVNREYLKTEIVNYERLLYKTKKNDLDFNEHYVGGFLWEDGLFNYRTVHSETLNKDVPCKSAGFVKKYYHFTYPITLWQHSGSICYDFNNDASSVLKSNKTLQYLKTSVWHDASNRSINVSTDLSYGSEVIKIGNTNTLYSGKVDSILLYKSRVYAIPTLRESLNVTNKVANNDRYEFYAIQDTRPTTFDDGGNPEYGKIPSAGIYLNALPYYPTYAKDGDSLGFTMYSPYEEFCWCEPEITTKNFDHSVDIRYLSTPHIVVKFGSREEALQYFNRGNVTSFIPLVDLQQDVIYDNMYGGYTDAVLQTNNFLPCGESVAIAKKEDGVYKPIYVNDIVWSVGDVYFQEYEILKTYPTSFENENCVTEVVATRVESYWNMNGRYDTWKGNPTFATSPANWNLMNPVYNQKDNFFVYHGLDLSTNSINDFPNSFTWTKTKWSGDTTDKWTHVTLASNMDVDGSKGRITKLIKLQDNLLCFQPRGLSQILYNEREQIATGSGVPIELANSGKVSGVRYVTERTGCNNKWSICKNETGLYWVDDENKAIMAWNQQLANLSDTLGFHSWINAKSNLLIWNPIEFDSFVTYYDPFNESVMFFYKDNMLSYNTQLNCFDSFFSYGYVPYYMAFNGTAFTLSDRDSDGKDTYKVWEQHKGDYNYFYVQDQCTYDSDMNIISKGKYDIYGSPTDYGFEPYYITLLVNPDMPYDKIFTNLDMRTDMWNKNKELLEETFSHIHVWNEFQENKSTLIRNVDIPKVHLPAQHSILKKKFRVWYIDIPRDIKHPDTRFYKRDRMRNTWLYVKLSKELIDDDDMITYPYISDNKHIIHHIGVSYFV